MAVAVLLGVVLLGALVQSGIGLGLGMVVTPVLSLVAPQHVPGSIILLSITLPVLTLAREHAHVDWRGVGATLAGRVPGSLLGLWLVVAVSPRGIGVVVALVVLTAVLLTATRVPVPHRPRSGHLVLAGVIGGASGTATAIGGPPVALLYQHRHGAQVRATMAVYFLGGHALALALLGGAGVLGLDDLWLAALLLPALLLGFALAVPLRPVLDGRWTRPAVLAVCSLSSLVLLARSLAG